VLKFKPKDKLGISMVQIVEVHDAVAYAVHFNGKPIRKRIENTGLNAGDPGKFKYSVVCFFEPGSAFRLCESLNKFFSCDEFTVVAYTPSHTVERSEVCPIRDWEMRKPTTPEQDANRWKF
jgi:hypothetical protein